MHRIFTISIFNIVSVVIVIAILFYRRSVVKKLRHLTGSGRVTEIQTMELRKEYSLMWISVIFLINLMARLLSLY